MRGGEQSVPNNQLVGYRKYEYRGTEGRVVHVPTTVGDNHSAFCWGAGRLSKRGFLSLGLI